MSLLKAFLRDRSGNAAMMFSLAVIGLVGLAGLAVEYSRGTSMQVRLSSAADAAALAGAKTNGTAAERQKAAKDMFEASVATVPGLANIGIVGQNVLENGVVIGFKVAVTGKMETTLGRIFGQNSIDIGAASKAVSGSNQNLEIAMALDTTGSMSGAKIDALKVAAKDLVSKLAAKAQTADQIKFAIVPFSKRVNVGLGNRNAPWIDVPADYSETKTVDVTTYPNATSTNCRMETFNDENDGVPYTYEAEVCDWDYGDPVVTTETQTETYTWEGCVGSRNYPLNTTDGSYTTKVPGLLDVSTCPNAILPLTSDKTAVDSAIDALSASGSTYIPTGLVWGWRVLSPGAPFGESAHGGSKPVQQVLILMTDGANTKSPTYPDHDGSDVALSNTLTAEICANIKASAAGIQVFTIAFEVTDPTIKSILQTCASTPASYYDASDATKLANAFNMIAEKLSALRLSQ